MTFNRQFIWLCLAIAKESRLPSRAGRFAHGPAGSDPAYRGRGVEGEVSTPLRGVVRRADRRLAFQRTNRRTPGVAIPWPGECRCQLRSSLERYCNGAGASGGHRCFAAIPADAMGPGEGIAPREPHSRVRAGVACAPAIIRCISGNREARRRTCRLTLSGRTPSGLARRWGGLA